FMRLAAVMTVRSMRVMASVTMFVMFLVSLVAEESDDHHARHVESRDSRSQQPDSIKYRSETSGKHRRTARSPKYLVIAEEVRKERKSGYGHHAHKHRPASDLHVLAQAAHITHILFVMHSDDNAARSQEEKGLEEGMRHDVEEARRESADSASQK